MNRSIAVTDVDCLVHPGGAVDDHAGANTISVYTAAGISPVPTEVLSALTEQPLKRPIHSQGVAARR